VVVAHGTDAECADILRRMRSAGVTPTIYSFNALLDRAARQGDEAQAMSVVTTMHIGGITADSTTYNTLLKLYVNRNDAKGAVKVVITQHADLVLLVETHDVGYCAGGESNASPRRAFHRRHGITPPTPAAQCCR
jgi:hypothetical protein